ncbi:hypothetical protein HN615_14340 [Candidatus Woesearchaeota archaeon]|nr:hypothetical protein [Candidatus Woesearchaeota archaeon]
MIKLKDIIKESKWADRNWGDPLPTLEDYMTEAESMKLQPKGGGKTVTFKDKDNYEKAKKSGDYEDPEGSGDGGEKEEPSGKLGAGDFERDTDTTRGDPDDSWDDDEGKPKPSGGDFTKSADYDMWSDDDPDAKQKGMDRASGLAKKGMEKRPGGEQAEKDYQKADQMIKKYAGRDIEKAEFWAKKKKQASDAMMGEITINSKQYKIISESINSTVFDPKGEIKSFWNRIKDK